MKIRVWFNIEDLMDGSSTIRTYNTKAEAQEAWDLAFHGDTEFEVIYHNDCGPLSRIFDTDECEIVE